MDGSPAAEVERTRWELLEQVEDGLETPMLVLSVVWLALFVVELVRGLGPFLETAGYVVWGVFVLDFRLRFTLAPAKGTFLVRNALTAVSLLLPALRLFRAVRVLRAFQVGRAARGVRLVKSLGLLNRGIRVTRAAVRRRGLGYVTASIASILVGRDNARPDPGGEAPTLAELRDEIRALRAELAGNRRPQD
ncbi:MAG TPA: hypothetical protein VEY95_06850 [Azospirillaceae bacterium]|nr:hypothetical protein [Azospirillaceae bacterium]